MRRRSLFHQTHTTIRGFWRPICPPAIDSGRATCVVISQHRDALKPRTKQPRINQHVCPSHYNDLTQIFLMIWIIWRRSPAVAYRLVSGRPMRLGVCELSEQTTGAPVHGCGKCCQTGAAWRTIFLTFGSCISSTEVDDTWQKPCVSVCVIVCALEC